MTALSTDSAYALINAARAFARTRSLSPMTIVVIDAAGQPKAALREDDSGLYSFDIALAKARGALALGISSREVGALFNDTPAIAAGLIAAVHGQLLGLPGAVPLRNAERHLLGALAAAGDMPDHDEAIVIDAATQMGFTLA